MEITLRWVGISIGIITILTWVWRVVNWVWLRPKKVERCLRKQGFNGNPYRILFGDTKENIKMTREARSKPINLSDDILPRVLPFSLSIHQELCYYAGKKSFTWNGPTPRVYIMDPELLKNIFNKINNFQKSTLNPLTKILVSGLVTYEGNQWAKHRKIINPAFHLEKLKHMVPAFDLSVNEMMEKWEELVSKDGGSCELDVEPYFENMTADLISRTAFGSSYEEGRKFFYLLTELATLTAQILQSIYIPGWRFLPTKTNRRLKKINKEIEVLINGIIKKRERTMEAGGEAGDDLLGILMESNLKEIKEHGNDNKAGMSIKEVIEECKIFYFAGQETTSMLLVWTMILLSIHQDWQSLAREEVQQVFGNDKPNFDGLNHLKIVTMILYEVLRLYPPFVMLTRDVSKDTKLGNMVLLAGVQVSMPIIVTQHDEEIWGEDAKEFNPERFSEGLSKATKNQLTFYPFAWGPRFCIGQNFAMTEAKMALTMILQRFSFDLSTTYAHAPSLLITLKPQHGAHIILHKLQ